MGGGGGRRRWGGGTWGRCCFARTFPSPSPFCSSEPGGVRPRSAESCSCAPRGRDGVGVGDAVGISEAKGSYGTPTHTHTALCPPLPPPPSELCPLRSHFATLELSSALSAAPGQPNPKRCCGPSAAVGSHPIPGLRSAPHPHPVFSRLPLPVSAVRCAALTAAQQLLQAAERDGSARTDGGERLRCPHSRPSAPPLCPELCRAAQRRARSASGFAHGPKKAFPALSPTRSSWQPRPRPAPRATSACVRQTPALKCSEGPTWARRINAGTPPPPIPQSHPIPIPILGGAASQRRQFGVLWHSGLGFGFPPPLPPLPPPQGGRLPVLPAQLQDFEGGGEDGPTSALG